MSRGLVDSLHQQAPEGKMGITIRNVAGGIAENNGSLITLLDSSGLTDDRTDQLRGQLERDRDYLENNIVSENQSPRSNPGAESKEENFNDEGIERAAHQMREALDHADEAAQFLRENLPAVRNEHHEEIKQQEVRGNASDSSIESDQTLIQSEVEEERSDNSGDTVNLTSAHQANPVQGNGVGVNNFQFGNFTGRILGWTTAQMATHRNHVNNARAAEARRDWRGAEVHWLAAMRTAAVGINETEEHQRENNTVYQGPQLTQILTARHQQWTTLQNQARDGARQAAANAGCCTIA